MQSEKKRNVGVKWNGIEILLFLLLQDTLRYLVQDSLALYRQTVHDGCHEVLNVQEDFVWGEDIIKSPFK